MNEDVKTQRISEDLILLDEAILKIKAPSDCISSAILRSDLKSNCTLKRLPKAYNTWKKLNLNTYLFYTNGLSGGWLRCSETRTKINKRSGIIKIPNDCSVSSYDLTIVGRIGVPAFSTFFLIPHEELNLSIKREEIDDIYLQLTTMKSLKTAELPPDIQLYEEGWMSIAMKYLWHIIGGILGMIVLIIASITVIKCLKARGNLDLNSADEPRLRKKKTYLTEDDLEAPEGDNSADNGVPLKNMRSRKNSWGFNPFKSNQKVVTPV